MARKRSPRAQDRAGDKPASRGKRNVAPPGAADVMVSAPQTDPRARADATTAVEEGFIEVELSDEAGASSGRRQARIPISGRVEVSGFFGVERAQAVSDVSLGGLFVETSHVLEVGDPVMLGFPDRGGKLRVAGRVRWVTPFGGVRDARPGMGIELVGVSDADRLRIFELLRGKRG